MAHSDYNKAAEGRHGVSQVTAFNPLSFRTRERPGGEVVRQAAQASRFYPGDAGDVAYAIQTHMAEAEINSSQTQPYRAIMLPHAGWKYCGDTIAKTLARVEVPELVIVIGPKHTAPGPECSVTSHRSWDLPGASIPIATEWVRYLVDTSPLLVSDADAHREEHGTEVLLPFLHHCQPGLRVVPIVLGRVEYEQAIELGGVLAALIDRHKQEEDREDARVLLVVSSDLNHFAPEPENRRRDQLAIGAMLTGDPANLYGACRDHDISMCGLMPAVAAMEALRRSAPIEAQLIDYRNSAAATGDTSRVVGYAGVLMA